MHLHNEHTMVMAAAYPDGSQVWACPTCGRRLLMKWPPNHSRSILEEGDPNAVHSGEISDRSLNSAEIAYPVEVDDPYLAPFKNWIENYGQ